MLPVSLLYLYCEGVLFLFLYFEKLFIVFSVISSICLLSTSRCLLPYHAACMKRSKSQTQYRFQQWQCDACVNVSSMAQQEEKSRSRFSLSKLIPQTFTVVVSRQRLESLGRAWEVVCNIGAHLLLRTTPLPAQGGWPVVPRPRLSSGTRQLEPWTADGPIALFLKLYWIARKV